MPNADQFTWKQRGAIDCILHVPFSQSPAPDMFERQQWEEGWMEQYKRDADREMRIAATAGQRVLASMREKL